MVASVLHMDSLCLTTSLPDLLHTVVNTVMATDIVDKDLKNLRNDRWEKAFQAKVLSDEDAIQEDVNRKATIVIEHLIQASDIAHTMQHWHIYRKWVRLISWSGFSTIGKVPISLTRCLPVFPIGLE